MSPAPPDEITNTERLVFDPEVYFDLLLADIARAKSSIILETYIFRVDEIGRKFIVALKLASKRGVSVRILIDGIGSSHDAKFITQQLQSENCQVRIFHPMPWDFPAYHRALTTQRWYSQLLRRLGQMNHRNHRKLCIIDDAIAWLGSFNITADHFNQTFEISADNWHDTGLRVTGKLAVNLKADFELGWQRKTASFKKRTARFLSNHSIQARNAANRKILAMLNTAKHRIWITNAYFNPSIRLLAALKKSARRGIDVRILVPSRTDVFMFPLLSRTYYADLLSSGIRVFEYNGRPLHSKTMLIDHLVLVGSTNLNYRSFFHDLELDVLLTSHKSVECMKQRYQTDISCSTEVTLEHWKNYPLLFRLLGSISRFFRYWL